ncbi:MAG TPA: PAS domain-containing sensor histidine kinase, partial [Bacteroidales bacterium]|nr:PAS domain-containing sensor histidine kinase [Bacteroidales bacterium]
MSDQIFSTRLAAIRSKKLKVSADSYTSQLEQFIEDLLAYQTDSKKKLEYSIGTIYNNMTDLLVLINCNGIIEFVSPACAHFGYSREDLIGRSCFGYVYESDLPEIINNFNHIVETGNHKQLEFRGMRKDGSFIWVSVNGNLVEQADNEKASIVCVVRDIQENKLLEVALKESEQRFRGMFEYNHAVMLIIDPDDLKILDANPAALEFYGYSYEQMKKLKISDINTLTSEQVKNEVYKARDAIKYRFDFKHQLADGTIRDVVVYSGLVKTVSQSYLYSIVHDVTDRKLAEAKIIENARELYELNLTKDKLFSVIAHDLRNPTGLILSLIDLYLSNQDKLTEKEKSDILHNLHKTASNAYELLENLLDWSHLQREKISPVLVNTSISRQINKSVMKFEPIANEKQIRIINKVNEKLEAKIDVNIFDAILRNLISNGIKFSYPGSK